MPDQPDGGHFRGGAPLLKQNRPQRPHVQWGTKGRAGEVSEEPFLWSDISTNQGVAHDPRQEGMPLCVWKHRKEEGCEGRGWANHQPQFIALWSGIGLCLSLAFISHKTPRDKWGALTRQQNQRKQAHTARARNGQGVKGEPTPVQQLAKKKPVGAAPLDSTSLASSTRFLKRGWTEEYMYRTIGHWRVCLKFTKPAEIWTFWEAALRISLTTGVGTQNHSQVWWRTHSQELLE